MGFKIRPGPAHGSGRLLTPPDRAVESAARAPQTARASRISCTSGSRTTAHSQDLARSPPVWRTPRAQLSSGAHHSRSVPESRRLSCRTTAYHSDGARQPRGRDPAGWRNGRHPRARNWHYIQVGRKLWLLVPAGRAQGQTVAVTARAIGFKPQTVQITLSEGPLAQDFGLAANPLQLGELVVTGAGTISEVEKLGSVRNSVDSSLITRSNETNIVTALCGEGSQRARYSPPRVIREPRAPFEFGAPNTLREHRRAAVRGRRGADRQLHRDHHDVRRNRVRRPAGHRRAEPRLGHQSGTTSNRSRFSRGRPPAPSTAPGRARASS